MISPTHVKFSPGELVITAHAQAQLPNADVQQAITRHLAGDWGDCSPDDREANDLALCDDSRLFSVYQTAEGQTFWIITEADRSVTTVLLPEDY